MFFEVSTRLARIPFESKSHSRSLHHPADLRRILIINPILRQQEIGRGIRQFT
jgi:hypothetical protein